jgi:hypothetical protein
MDSNSSEDFSNTAWSFELFFFSTLLGLGSDIHDIKPLLLGHDFLFFFQGS